MNKKIKRNETFNNRGFAIAGIVYSILLLFVILLTSLLVMLGNRKRVLDNLNKEIASSINDFSALKINFKYKDVVVANASKVSNFSFQFLKDVQLTYSGEELDQSYIQYNSNPVFDGATNGKYVVTYTATYQGFTTTAERTIFVVDPNSTVYDFTGAAQSYVADSSGLYEIELWGGQGAYGASVVAGKGAYTKGEIDLKKDDTLYVYVGEGLNRIENGLSFNGGRASNGGWPGGGATDVRLASGDWNNFDSLKSRIMVAAGSGSANDSTARSGSGGTLIGLNGGGATGGTQISFGSSQDVQSNRASFGIAGDGCAGGNGYYPGGGALCSHGSGGGSSFISGHIGCNAIASSSISGSIIHTGQPNHYSGKIFTNTVMLSGDEIMPNYDGTSTMIGNVNHGYAKITPLVLPLKEAHFNVSNVTVANESKVSHFAFNPLYGVEFIGEDGKKVNDATITYTSSPSFDGSKNGTYTFTYHTTYNGLDVSADRIVKVANPISKRFKYNGSMQTYTVEKEGLYGIELWGAQGSYGSSLDAGKGAYTKGEIDLKKEETLYVYVGEGLSEKVDSSSFNGGKASNGGFPGGGATDVRLSSGDWNNFDSLKSRIMVAAGSGSANDSSAKSGSGGTLVGIAGGESYGGTQTSFGTSPHFVSSFGIANGGCTGGNGYYPGGGALCTSGAGGGSSFISGHVGCDAIAFSSRLESVVHTGQPNHYSGKIFTNTVMIDGDHIMPKYDSSGTMQGNEGHGYAKITPFVIYS